MPSGPAVGHPDTARGLLKSLFQADASLHADPQRRQFRSARAALARSPPAALPPPLLDELNRTCTRLPGTGLRPLQTFLSAPEPSPNPATKPPIAAHPLLLGVSPK